MTCWLLKQSDQTRYLDIPGRIHIYNNTHSLHVAPGDRFIYLDKRTSKYAFNGHGVIDKVESRDPEISEQTHPRIKRIYTASLADYVEYARPIDMRYNSVGGRRNRSLLGIADFNHMGWSASVARIDGPMFDRIVDFAYSGSIFFEESDAQEYEISDRWSSTKIRYRRERFRNAVIARQGAICAICGTTLKAVLEVAHISPYATDPSNRANPANGIVMCVFCHRAFDQNVY